MANTPIHHLSLEQEALLFGYRDRWNRLPLKGDRRVLAAETPDRTLTDSPSPSTQTPIPPYDPAKAAEAIKMGYALCGLPDPDIIHCPSPLAAYKIVITNLETTIGSLSESRLGAAVGIKLHQALLHRLVRQLSQQLSESMIETLQVAPYSELGVLVGAQMGTSLSIRHFLGLALGVGGSQALERQLPWVRPLTNMLLQLGFQKNSSFFDLPIEVEAFDGDGNPVTDQMHEIWGGILGNEQSLHLLNCLEPELWAAYCGYMDFFFSIMGCEYHGKTWYALKYWVKHCGWVLPFEQVAISCARPTHLLFDLDDRIHASGEPAIQYADGLRVYAHHGVRQAQ